MLALVRDLRIVLLFSLALSLFVGAFLLWQAQPASAQQVPTVARGQYLVTAGPCAECHTPRVQGDPTALDQSKFLAGGEEFTLPFGTIYSSNLTPDVATGIGSWSIGDIVRALDEGLDNEGNPLILMPWQEFRGMAALDKISIALYLKSIPAVSNAVPASQLAVPREALYAQAAAEANELGPGTPPGPEAGTLATGQYLVWSVLGCAGCHGTNLAGGVPFGPVVSSNITPAGHIADWTDAQLVTAIRTGVRPDGSTIFPAMPYGDRAYGNLTDADAQAVAQYLRTVPEAQPLPPPGGGDIVLNPLWLAGAGLVLLLAGFALLGFRLRRATPAH